MLTFSRRPCVRSSSPSRWLRGVVMQDQRFFRAHTKVLLEQRGRESIRDIAERKDAVDRAGITAFRGSI
jgi:hypothetical protein